MEPDTEIQDEWLETKLGDDVPPTPFVMPCEDDEPALKVEDWDVGEVLLLTTFERLSWGVTPSPEEEEEELTIVLPKADVAVA